jgi:hypothetical protein
MTESEQERSDAAKKGHRDEAQPAPAPSKTQDDRSKAAEDRPREADGRFEPGSGQSHHK